MTKDGKKLSDPGPYLETLNGEPVVSVYDTFHGNENITTAPAIHSNIQNMRDAFRECKNLKTYAGSTAADGDFSGYVIPNSVVNMSDTFRECTSLRYAPVIPSSVTDISSLFHDCTSLTGTVTINANIDGNNISSGDVAANCFSGVNFQTQRITLAGSCAYLDQIATESSSKKNGRWENGYCEECNGYCAYDYNHSVQIDTSNVQNLSIVSTEAGTFDLESRPNLLLTLTPDEGYLLPESFTVAIGETVYTINTNGENEQETMFFDTESSTLYILGDLLPEPEETEPTEPTEPGETEPTEPEGTEPTEPGETESTEPERKEPPATEPPVTEPPSTEPPNTNEPESEQIVSEIEQALE